MEQIENNQKNKNNSKNEIVKEVSLMNEKISKMREEELNEKKENDLIKRKILQENINIYKEKIQSENVILYLFREKKRSKINLC